MCVNGVGDADKRVKIMCCLLGPVTSVAETMNM